MGKRRKRTGLRNGRTSVSDEQSLSSISSTHHHPSTSRQLCGRSERRGHATWTRVSELDSGDDRVRGRACVRAQWLARAVRTGEVSNDHNPLIRGLRVGLVDDLEGEGVSLALCGFVQVC